MMKVAVTGLNGVIGKVFGKEISPNYDLIDLYHDKKYTIKLKQVRHIHIDLLNKPKIAKALELAKPDVILHLASITHIDACEKDRELGERGNVWKTNVDGTNEIAKFCKRNKIFLIFLSTECVFDGEQKIYTENSKKNPKNWYGITKSKAEDAIQSSGAQYAIIRSVVAYHRNDLRKTIYGKILEDLRDKKNVKAVSDQIFTPTHTHDIVRAINTVIQGKLEGIYHVAPRNSLSPYEFAKLVAKRNNYPLSCVKKTTLVSLYGKDRANLRLTNASLNGIRSQKILKFTPEDPKDVL